MKTHRAFLVVDASGGMRVVKSAPHLALGQVAFRLIVNVPDSWAKVVGDIKLDLPEPPEPEVFVEFAQ